MHRLGKNKTEREYVVYLAAATLNVHMCQRPIANIQTYEESAKKAKKKPLHTSFTLDSIRFIKEASPFPTTSFDTHANRGMTCRQRCKQCMPLIARTNDSSA